LHDGLPSVSFIGYILVDKNTAISGHCLNMNTIFQKDFSDIARYILQHGKGLIWQGLHQISQGRQFLEIMKVLTHIEPSKGGFHCDHPDGPEEASKRQPVLHLVQA